MKKLLTREKVKMAAGLHSGLLMLVFLAVISSVAFAAPVDQAVTINVLDSNPNQIVIQYRFGEFAQRPISIEGQSFTEVYLGKEALKKDKGAPALPDVSRSIIIPDDAQMAVSVVDSSYYEVENISIPPSKGNILRNVNPADVPYTFGKAYRADKFYPGELATLREPYIMRDYRGGVVTVHPFQYNPVGRVLRVYTDITVEVTTIGKGGVNVLSRGGHKPKKSRAFRDIYSSQFINYSAGERLAIPDEQGNMLIIAYDPWVSNLQPLVDHKNNIGINTTIVGVSTIGNNSTSIKNYIQNVYNTGDLTYVLLVGDATQVATPTASGGSSDPSYSKLAGSDDYPDIFVGRFSAETAADVDTQVLKTIEYENMPATQQDWFWRGVGIASPEGGSSTGDDGESDQQHIEGLRLQLLSYNYTLVDQIYEAAGPTKADITNALNAGRGIINYCGHGSTTAWGTTGFSVTDVLALINQNMLPFIFDVACVNGQFSGYTCFAEAWMRATNGNEPTGAIGIYASSINQSWAPPMEAQDAFNSLYIAGTYSTYGALCYAGACSMMDKYGSGGVSMFNTWHIFGDPSLRVVGSAVIDTTTASNPAPANGATGVEPNINLSWSSGAYAGSHDVYFGTDYNSVSEANYSSGEFKGNQPLDYNSFSPGILDYSTTYYWAIDEVNEANIWPGNVWMFTTAAPPDTNPPTPDPMTWATVPYATGSTSISMTATTASDSSGVEYYFECTAGEGHNSGWQDSTTYRDTGLSPSTQYTYRVKAHDKSPNYNETAWSTEQSATTQPPSVEIIGSWITGTTHAKESGTNRALVFVAHAKSSSSSTNLTAVSYGGRPMTKIISKIIGSSSSRAYVAAFILKESDIAAATNATFTLTWTSAPSNVTYTSAFFQNVNQTTPVGATASNGVTSATSISTSALSTGNGDMVIENAAGSTTGTYTITTGWTKDVDLGVSGYDGMDGHKPATGASETPSISHPSGNHVLIGFVVKMLPLQAAELNPSNLATNVSLDTDLSWTAGVGATSHDVYFGTTNPPSFQVNQTDTVFDPGTLLSNTTYYWRIDEHNAGGTTTGEVWSFTTVPPPPAQAGSPTPADGATNVGLTTDLGWTTGAGATSHDVYFGTTNPPPFKANQTSTTYDTGTMSGNTTYYWRIDEKNAGGTTTGIVWSFTTINPPPSVGIIGSWATGTTHAKESGTNRALVFIAHAEHSASTTLNSVTYGGRAMTKVVERIISSGSTRTYVAAFILNDVGINVATTTTFTPTWSVTPTSSAYASVFLQNVNQSTLTGATAGNATSTGATITTSALATNNGDMVIDAATCSSTGSYTVNNGFTEALELSISNADAVDGYKSATGANETPSVTHSTSNSRQSLIGLVVRSMQ